MMQKKNHMTADLFYVNTVGHFNDTHGNNEGLKIRRQKAKENKDMDMICRLHSDIFTQRLRVLNGVDVKVKVIPTKDVFNLITPNSNIDYKSIISYAALVERNAKVNPGISLAQETASLQSNAKYPLIRVVM